jgi:hypothetical protein
MLNGQTVSAFITVRSIGSGRMGYRKHVRFRCSDSWLAKNSLARADRRPLSPPKQAALRRLGEAKSEERTSVIRTLAGSHSTDLRSPMHESTS